MAVNLINPVTRSLEIGQLSKMGDECYSIRTGYEVIVANEKYALVPIATDDTAQIGEEVQVDSMGIMTRGRVIRVLSGSQEEYTDQILLEEVEQGFQFLERHFDVQSGLQEKRRTRPLS